MPRDQDPPQFDAIAEARRQWVTHGWGAPEAMAAATSIVRAHQLVLAAIDGALRPLGLTFARYEALVLLRFSRAGSLPLGKMGERLMVHPASITNSINRLEVQGLVERVAHDRDGRMVLARITPEGRELVERATTALAAIEFGLAGVPAQDTHAVAALIRRLRVDLGDLAPDARPTLPESFGCRADTVDTDGDASTAVDAPDIDSTGQIARITAAHQADGPPDEISPAAAGDRTSG